MVTRDVTHFSFEGYQKNEESLNTRIGSVNRKRKVLNSNILLSRMNICTLLFYAHFAQLTTECTALSINNVLCNKSKIYYSC